MNVLTREGMEVIPLPGRTIQKAVGKDSLIVSYKMTMGFGYYSSASGPMEPHQHAEEICYILDAKNSWVRYGALGDGLKDKFDLLPGMILHIPEMELHVFEFSDDGYVDLIFFYGQVDGIRPEERASAGLKNS
jgi:hypothetical protein